MGLWIQIVYVIYVCVSIYIYIYIFLLVRKKYFGAWLRTLLDTVYEKEELIRNIFYVLQIMKCLDKNITKIITYLQQNSK